MLTTQAPARMTMEGDGVAMEGSLTTIDVMPFRGDLEYFASQFEGGTVTVDLSRVTDFDSHGQALLTALRRALVARDKRLVLLKPSPVIVKFLKGTNHWRTFEMQE